MDGGRLTSRKDKLPPLLAALNHVENRGRVQYGASPPRGHMATPTCAGCLSGHVPIGAGEEGVARSYSKREGYLGETYGCTIIVSKHGV